MSSIITEGRVSANILKFADKTFLFTGTVCKTWHKNSNSTETGAEESIESSSRLEEAMEHGLNVYLASFCSVKSADISIVRRLNETTCLWEQEDIERAAEHGRIDILELMHEKGYPADERVLHNAVRFNRPSVVKYLLRVGCPIDKTVIEWGFGSYIIDELKMRSMEVAISEDNLPMVKILRTVDYPFVEDSFTFACDTENVDMLKYLLQEGCEPPTDLFRESVELCNYFTLNFLIDNGLLREEWDLWGCILDDDEDMMHFLLEKGIKPTDDDVDSAIGAGNMEVAKFLTHEYMCRPTPQAYMLTFDNLFCDCHYLVYLNWLYDEMHCSLGFILLEEMQEDPTGSYILEHCSSTIEDWFEERLC